MQIFSKSFIRQKDLIDESLLVLLTKDIGKGSFIQCQAFQDIETKQNKQKRQQQNNEEQDFYLDVDESNQLQQIKQEQFHKFINTQQKKIQNNPNTHPPNLQIQSFNFAFGANKGNNTVQLVEERICRAIGANILIGNSVKPQIYSNTQSHVYEITYLRFDKMRSTLYSGASDGKRSEIIQWKYNPQNKDLLTFQRKISLPPSSLGIHYIFIMKNQMICITKCSIQRQSQLLKIQLDSNSPCKKMKSQAKIGKIINALLWPNVLIVNQNGLHRLNENYQLVSLYQNNQTIIALQNIDENNIILGLIDGSVIVFNILSTKIVSQFKLSKSRIVMIRMLAKNQFIIATKKQQIIQFEIDQYLKEFKVFQSIKAEDNLANILVSGNNIFLCTQKGKIQYYSFMERKLRKQANKMEDKFYLGNISSNQTKMQQIIYNKQLKKYLFFYRKSLVLNLFEVDEEQNMKDISSVELTHPIQFLDTFGNYVASVCGQNQQFLQIFDLLKSASALVINKLPFTQCTCVKFSPFGDRVALGFSNGVIVLYTAGGPTMLTQLCRNQKSKEAGLFHRTSIQNIIWNAEGSAIKTFSRLNLLYYLIFNNNNQYSLLLYSSSNKKKAQKDFQQKIQKAEWIQMGRFNYRNSKLLENCQQINEYGEFKQTKDFIFVSQSDGCMKIFNNPIKQRTAFQTLRWFRQPYKYLIIESKEVIKMLIYCNNIMLSVNLQMIA